MKTRCAEIVLTVATLWAMLGCAPLQSKSYDPLAYTEAQSFVDRGTRLLRRGELDQAEASFEVAYSIHPLPAALDGLGAVAHLRGDHRRALTLYSRALDQDPGYHHALGNIALLAEEFGSYRQVDELYRRAIEANPNYAPLRNNYAAFLASQPAEHRRVDKARAELRRAQVLTRHDVIDDNFSRLNDRDTYTEETEHDSAQRKSRENFWGTNDQLVVGK